MIGPFRLCQSLLRDRKGAAVTEFGLVLIPLLIVILGAIDVGYQSYVRTQLQGVLHNVARKAVVENPDFGAGGATIEEQIENAIEERVNDIARNATYTIEQTNFFEFSGVGEAEKLITDVNQNGQFDQADGDCWQDLNENGMFDLNTGRDGRGGADDVVYYRVTLEMPRLVPVMSFIGVPDNYTIRAQTAVRNQPYSDQRIPPTVCA